MAINKVTKTKIAVSYSAYGKKVRKPFKVPYKWESFKDYDSVKEAKAELTEKQMLKAVNAAEQAKQRSAALNAAYDAAGFVKETAATSALIRLKDMHKTLMLSTNSETGQKYTDAEARALASKYVGAQWPSETDVDEDEDEGEDGAEEESTEDEVEPTA